jgi:hypothetical protein
LFDEATAVLPRRNRLPLVIAGVFHLVLLGFLIFVRTKPLRVSPEGSPSGGIAAYVSGPVGGTPAAAAPRPEPKKTAFVEQVEDEDEPATFCHECVTGGGVSERRIHPHTGPQHRDF